MGANRSFEAAVASVMSMDDLPPVVAEYMDADEPVREPPRRVRLERMERATGIPWRVLFLFFAIDAGLWPRDYSPTRMTEQVKERYEQADEDTQRRVLALLEIPTTGDDVPATFAWAATRE